MTKLNPFSGKKRLSMENYVNKRSDIASILGKGFDVTLSSKINVVNLRNWHFAIFCNFLSEEVETIFWKKK